MKKVWNEPSVQIQEFVPNEYVSLCWTVACQVGEGNYGEYSWAYWNGIKPNPFDQPSSHDHTGSCSIAKNNQFRVDNNGNVYFYAENSSDQGLLSGVYTTFIDKDSDNQISNGDIIFWYTKNKNDGRIWDHYGVVTNPTPNHPNRS